MRSRFIFIILALGILTAVFLKLNPIAPQITNFEECVAAGNPVLESYPEQCRANGKTFIRDIGNELEKSDTIRISEPRPSASISSPLKISGEARGTWFFEATFPILLLDSNGNEIGSWYAQADGDWMTEDFVPFSATLEFEQPANPNVTLVLRKDNPSGLPENDDELRIPLVVAN